MCSSSAFLLLALINKDGAISGKLIESFGVLFCYGNPLKGKRDDKPHLDMITFCNVDGFDLWLHVGSHLVQQDLGCARRCLPLTLLVLLATLRLVLGGRLCHAGPDVVPE